MKLMDLVSELVTELVAERTGLPDTDPDCLFIDFGIGSADAVALAEALGAHLGVELPNTVFYDHPTPRALARHLEGLAAGGRESDRDRRPAGPYGAEPVAIVGIGCRLPGADSPGRLWELLTGGEDVVGPVPQARSERYGGWAEPGVGVGGFLPDVEAFDPGFFAINAREAAATDPQQRMLLEVAHESLQDAGLRMADVAESQTGVYVGISSGDFLVGSFTGETTPDGYTPTGVAHSVAANRISYAFDLHGPSMAIDTACSSSLVAVHQAVLALQSGQCDTALAGGANAILAPDIGLCFRTAGVLAPDGRCKSFGAGADGMGRSEGAVMVTLRRLPDALAAGDRVYALIRGGAVNSDGRTNGLMSPSAPAQSRLLRAACRAAGVAPGDVGYVEAHGSGTRLGDLMELRALSEVLGGAERGEPLRVGSVKSNLAHLEAAAGAAGLVKVALSLFHGRLPASLHADRPAEDFDWAASGLRVQTGGEPWAGRLAGVSSFGFGGTNAHLILQTPPAREQADVADRHYLPLSAHTPAALRQLAERWRAALAGHELDLAAACHTAGGRRDHHAYRVAVSGADAAQLGAELERALTDLIATPPAAAAGGGLALVFTDEEAQVEAAVALADELSGAGMHPDLVIGHGAAELTAARYCGVLAPAEADAVAGHRARLLATLLATLPSVRSLRVRLARRLADALCQRMGPGLAVAVVEDAQTCVLVGAPEALARVSVALAGSDVLFGDLGPATPDHSALAAPVAAELAAALAGLPVNVGESTSVSTLTGAPVDGRAQGAGHWARHLSEPSLLGEALGHALDRGVRTFVEIGPGRLGPRLRAVAAGRPAWIVRCASPGDVPSVLIRLYELGHDLDWRVLTPAAGVASVPLLPWSREWSARDSPARDLSARNVEVTT